MKSPTIRPEVVLPLQDVVSGHIDEVHACMESGRIGLASIAMKELLRTGARINYSAVGMADINCASHNEQLKIERDDLISMRQQHELWISKQQGADVSKNPKLLGSIIATQARIKSLQSSAIPKIDKKIADFAPTVEEIESIAEITGEAWPYYPELSPGRSGQEDGRNDDVETISDTVDSYRTDIHNIISRLSYDKKGGLGLRYNVLTAFFFNQEDAQTKSKYAQALASMIRDGEVKIWKENDERFIESTLPETTKPIDETEAKMIVVQLDPEDEISKTFVAGIFRNYGLEGYRRIEHDDKLELQVPLSFANQFALSNKLVLSKHGPSSYRLLDNE